MPVSHTTVVAHPDDDLLFINPDIQHSISAGRPTQTITVSASEYNGVPGQRTREEYAADQQSGQRAAYAHFAGVADRWTRQAVQAGPKLVEIDALVAAPHVQLVYLNLPDGMDELYDHALHNLWRDAAFTTPTLVPTGSAVGQAQRYGRADLLAVLVALMQRFGPTTLRVQDPWSDPRYANEHEDHSATWRFATAAARTYSHGGTWKPLTVLSYRSYATQSFPRNVGEPLLAAKTEGMNLYRAHDPLAGPALDQNLSRLYYRWPVTGRWAVRDGTGALHAFAVFADCVAAWHKPLSGAWAGPTVLSRGDFAPGVSAAVADGGLVRVVALDLTTNTIKTTVQTGADGGFGMWTDLGSPAPHGPDHPFTGGPTITSNLPGGFEVLVRDPRGGIAVTFQNSPTGPFGGWQHIDGGGPDLQDPLNAFTPADHRLEVLANDGWRVGRWRQQVADGPIDFDGGLPFAECSEPPAAVSGPVVVTREHLDGAIGLLAGTLSGWDGPHHLGGHGGIGTTAVARTGTRVLAFARDDTRGIGVRQLDSGTWTSLGGFAEVGPAAVVDRAGAVHVLVVGGDARLQHRVQPAAGGAFSPWQSVQAGTVPAAPGESAL